ncbi:hypothetical protein R5R35_004814 [Gryllus longicercus]|uniref:Uncharacterized protein n=1 Tax=Gryllus longicercus TaxID=2509291 RepID=A0AAN9Z8U6_9ORTH
MAWRATLLVVAVTAASAIAAPAPAPSPSDLAAEAALIGDLARHFQIDAVCLVREEPLNASRHVHLATLQKELSKRSVRNHVASMEDFYKKRMKLKHYLFRTLYVITLPDKTGQNFLVETSRNRKWALSRMFMVLLNIYRKGGLARGNVWLVLLRARPAVEPRTFLRRVRLTAETQLLLALPAGGDLAPFTYTSTFL